MSPRVGTALVLGSLLFLGITFFEQIPVVGWLGALVSFGAWSWLAGEVRRGGGGIVAAAIVGGVTGLVGAVSAWMLQVGNLFGPDTPGLARFGAGLGTIGASVFLVLWPLVGAAICGASGAVRTRRSIRGPASGW